MYEFKVEGMTCGHCIQAITRAVISIDPNAKVTADIPSQSVKVESAEDPKALAAKIEDSGYACQLR